MTACVMAFFRLGKRIPLHGLDYARLAADAGPAACEPPRLPAPRESSLKVPISWIAGVRIVDNEPALGENESTA